MNTTFKKTLVASAILAFAGAAQAATLAGTERSVTAQYLAGAGVDTGAAATEFRTATVALTLGAEYTINDTITLTFSTPVKASTLPVTITAAPDVPNNRLGMTFSQISVSADSKVATYRLTATDATGLGANPVTTGVALTVPALDFLKSNLTSGASVTFAAKTNTGLDLDTAGGAARTASLVKAIAQFTTTAPSFSKVIDVNADRKSFVGADVNAKKITATFNIVSEVTGGVIYARPINGTDGVKHTVTGDFSWVADDSASAGLQPKAGVFTTTGTCTNPAWTYSTTAVSLECDEVAANTAIVIDAEANKTGLAAAAVPVFSPQSFTATSTVVYTTPAATENVFNNTAAGSWTLNGSQVRVPYLVVQEGRFNSIINVTNHGTKAGAITIDVFDEMGTKVAANYAAGTSQPGSVTSVAQAAKDALAAAGKDLTMVTKYSVQIVTNVPEDDVIVYAAYTDSQNGGERAIVNNDSKVQTKN
ncbi:hypothetical protein MN202_01135 [Rheinheimera muenzenbergensis]|uniref:Uncharacterized protein n=1 Tax=Rheinheimera muenzenbergensis TaxID=1193628 RepID=A0ABU8C1P0_9GAMM